MTKERIYVSPLEIRLFCNVYYNEEDDMCSLVIDGEEYVEDEEGQLSPKRY